MERIRNPKYSGPFHVYKDVCCANCQVKLTKVLPDNLPDDIWYNLQAEDALELRIGGGYGMYCDDGPLGTDRVLMLCKNCADKLFELFPCFGTCSPKSEKKNGSLLDIKDSLLNESPNSLINRIKRVFSPEELQLLIEKLGQK